MVASIDGEVAIYVVTEVRGPWGNEVAISNGRSKFNEATYSLLFGIGKCR